MYTRKEIHESVGGELESYLPRNSGRVVCGCFDPKLNPDAPDKILVGGGTVIMAAAGQFAVQQNPVPIFMKHRTNEWKYIGEYKVASSTRSVAIVNSENARSGRNNITRVLYLEPSSRTPSAELQ